MTGLENLDGALRAGGVGNITGGGSYGVDAFAGGGADVAYLGVHKDVTRHVQASGIELALLNVENDNARKVIDSMT